MPRPRKCRRIENPPDARSFRPAGGKICPKKSVVLFIDEVEALRLTDLDGLSQEEAAVRMEVSRQTVSRLVGEAHRKVADAIVGGKSIVIEGREQIMEKRQFKCGACNHEWELDFGTGCPDGCPVCKSKDFHRVNCGFHYQRGEGCGKEGGHKHHHNHAHKHGECCGGPTKSK